MKEVGIIIDLYQPPTQDEGTLKQAVNDLYNPLIRLIKSKRDIQVTLNIPLSTLELFDTYGYSGLLKDIKDLYMTERVDLTGSSAYGMLLSSDYPDDVVENEIILNEYGVGYYLGARQGFEGEPSIMIKDLEGFIPTEKLLTDRSLKIVENLGYRWTLLDSSCLAKDVRSPKTCVYKISESDICVITLDEKVTGLIDSYCTEDIQILKKKLSDALTGGSETRSVLYVKDSVYLTDRDKYKKQYSLIDVLIEICEEKNISVSNVVSIIKNSEIKEISKKDIPEMARSTSENKNNVLEFFLKMEDRRVQAFRDMEKVLIEQRMTNNEKQDLQDYCTAPIWKEDAVSLISDSVLQVNARNFILLGKYVCFDKYNYLYYYLNEPEEYKYFVSQIKKFVQYATTSSDILDDKKKSKLINSSAESLISAL